MKIDLVWKYFTNKKGEKYAVRVVFDNKGKLSDESSCTCRWWSYYGQSEKNKKDKWMCRHIVKAYAEIIKVSPMRARKVLIKQGIINKNHLRKI